MSRPVPIRRSLLINLLTVLSLLSVAVVGTMWLSARRAVQKLSAAVIEQALDRAEAKLEGLFDPVEGQLAPHLNEQLCADLPQEKFITAWLGLLDSATHSASDESRS